MNVAVFYPNGKWEIKEVHPNNAEDLQELVGGYIEMQYSDDYKFCVYVNETGILDGLRQNLFAYPILQKFGFQFCPAGPAVLVECKEDETEVSLSPESIEKIKTLIKLK